MYPEKYTVTWHSHQDYLREMMRGMMTSEDFTDVTLVTDDKKTLKAHRNILSACSPVFKNILQMEINKSHPSSCYIPERHTAFRNRIHTAIYISGRG